MEEIIQKLGDLCHKHYKGCDMQTGDWQYSYDMEVIEMLESEEVQEIIQKEIDKAREEGKREQAELDRALYSVSFEHIKNADFEKILLESVDKARENAIKDLIKKIEEAHCDSISLELLKEIDLSKLRQ